MTEDGGGGGIRTHEALITPTAFRERHLKPLGHPSRCQIQGRSPAYLQYARRDSNPRPLGPQPNALSTELRARDAFSDAGVRSTGIKQYSMRDHLMARGWRGRTIVCAQDNRRGGKSKVGYRYTRAGRCGARVSVAAAWPCRGSERLPDGSRPIRLRRAFAQTTENLARPFFGCEEDGTGHDDIGPSRDD